MICDICASGQFRHVQGEQRTQIIPQILYFTLTSFSIQFSKLQVEVIPNNRFFLKP